MRLRVLVTGSRTWDDPQLIRKVFAELDAERDSRDITLVHGDARGADRLAAGVARELGWKLEPHPANWTRWGKQAGYIRNVAMVGARVDCCYAFIVDESAGASHCAAMAEQRGIPTRRFTVTSVPA